MMGKQNKGSDFLPIQTRKNSELSIILTSLIFHCELTRIIFCPPRSSTGKWVVMRRELGGNAVDGKSVAVEIGVGYQEDPQWAKKLTPWVRGIFWKTTWAVLYFDDRAYFWSYGPLNTETILVISVIYLCPLCNLKTVCDIFLIY